MAARPGIAVNTIFGLKEVEILNGAKRKLKFVEEREFTNASKCLKVDTINDLICNCKSFYLFKKHSSGVYIYTNSCIFLIYFLSLSMLNSILQEMYMHRLNIGE